jgi:hypothetical protein
MSVLLTLLKEEKYRPSAASENTIREKLEKAIEWMGSRWVFHKDYVYNPKHRIYKTNAD